MIRRIERTLGPRFSRRPKRTSPIGGPFGGSGGPPALTWAAVEEVIGNVGGSAIAVDADSRPGRTAADRPGVPPAAAPPSDRPELAPMSEPATDPRPAAGPQARAPSRSPGARSPCCCSTPLALLLLSHIFAGFDARRARRRVRRGRARRPGQRARLAGPGAADRAAQRAHARRSPRSCSTPCSSPSSIELIPGRRDHRPRRGHRDHGRADAADRAVRLAAGARRRRRLGAQRPPAGAAPPRHDDAQRGARGCCCSRSTGSRTRSSSAPCATGRCRTSPAGSPPARTGSSSWETDLSSQTGACQAGILHGNNDDWPAFRWWEKETRQADRHQPPARRGRARAPALRRPRPAPRRRRQPRQHPLRRRAPLDADDEHRARPPAAARRATTPPTSPSPTRC